MPRLLAVLMLFLFAACNKENVEFTNFDVFDNTETVIHTTSSLNKPVEISTPEIECEESPYNDHKTKKNLVEFIQLNEIRLIILSPSNKTFDFLKDVELYISAKNLPDQKVASLYGLPDNVSNQINLNADQVNVKKYLARDKYRFKLKLVNDKGISQPVKIAITSKFQVDAKKSGH